MGDERVQGEGNYDAARRYRREAEKFVDSGRVDDAAQAAVPASPDEAAELEAAERAGKERAAEEDPLLRKGGQGPAR